MMPCIVWTLRAQVHGDASMQRPFEFDYASEGH